MSITFNIKTFCGWLKIWEKKKKTKQTRKLAIQLLSCVWLFATPWIAAHQASLSFTNSWSLLRLVSIELVMPSNHLILCRPLLLLPSIFPSIRVFSIESLMPSNHLILCCPLLFLPSIFPSIRVFSNESVLGSPYSPRDSQESSPTPQFKSIYSSTSSYKTNKF